VRFLAGGRSEETPTAIGWEGGWLEVRLLGEERLEGPEAGGPRLRRLRLADAQGRRYELSGPDGPQDGLQDGLWRVRLLGPSPAAGDEA
jgi:hypothetical protein